MADHLTSLDDKQRFWSDTIAAWKDSGLSQKKYCDQEQLTYSTFVYWRGRVVVKKKGFYATYTPVSIIFSLIFATVLTLLFVSVVYSLLFRVSFKGWCYEPAV